MANSTSLTSDAAPDLSCPQVLSRDAIERPTQFSVVENLPGNIGSEKDEFAASERLDREEGNVDDVSIKGGESSVEEDPLCSSSVVNGPAGDANFEKSVTKDFNDLDLVKENGNEAADADRPCEFEITLAQPLSELKAEGFDAEARVVNSVTHPQCSVNETMEGLNEEEIKSDQPIGKLKIEGSDSDVRLSSSLLNRQSSMSKLNARAPVFVPKGIISFPQTSGASTSARNATPSIQSAAVTFQSSHLGPTQAVNPCMLQQLETYSVLQQLETYSVTSRFGSDISVPMPGPKATSPVYGAESPSFLTEGSVSLASASRSLQYAGHGSSEQVITGFAPEDAVEAEFMASQVENFSHDVAATSASTIKSVLSDELKAKIVKQVEFYFSDANLPTDNHLMKFFKKDPEGFVPIPVVASFRKIKGLAKSPAVVAEALRASSLLVVSEDGRKVRRAQPLPDVDLEEVQSRTVVAENLPEDHSIPQMEQLFGTVGNVKMVRICKPEAANSANQTAAKFSKTDLLVSNKLHALVEYESVEEAERAVAELTDQRNWRSGLRVRLLLRRTFQGKHGHQYSAKGRKTGTDMAEGNDREEDGAIHDGAVEKTGDDSGRQSEALEEPMGDAGSHEREGGRRGRGRNRGRGRGRGQHINNISRGTPPQSSSPLTSELIGKPPPGPRMPDGTRGFTMGRGRLLSADIL